MKVPRCSCGICRNCHRRANYERAATQEDKTAPRCQWCGRRERCECAKWDEIFERNHGETMRDYYSPRAIHPQSPLSSLGRGSD